jgi:cholinesterase
MAAYPNSQIVANASAVHGAEISLVWGTMTNTPTAASIPNTLDEEVLSKNMRHLWAGFAKDPVNGLEKMGYPKYDPKKETLLRLGNGSKGAIDLVNGAMYDKDCPDPNAPPVNAGGMLSGLASLMGLVKGSPAKAAGTV